MADRQKLLGRLKANIKIAIEWNGRQSDDPEKTYDADSDCGFTYPIDQAEKSIKDSIARSMYEDQDEADKYQLIKNQVDVLNKKISGLRDEIIKRARNISEVDNLPDEYVDSVAKRFIRDNKKDCLVVAPDLWLPTIITEE